MATPLTFVENRGYGHGEHEATKNGTDPLDTSAKQNGPKDFELKPHSQHRSRLSMMSTWSSQTHVSRRRFTAQPDVEDIIDLIGEEPGIDIQNTVVELPESVGSIITVIDYNRDHKTSQTFDVRAQARPVGPCCICGPTESLNTRLDDILENCPVKDGGVRWIVVNGLSWEALGPIAAFYDLHPLAIEATLEFSQRAKAEVFKDHTFCRFPLYRLARKTNDPNTLQKLVLAVIKKFKSLDNTHSSENVHVGNDHLENSNIACKWDSPALSSHSIPFSSTTACSTPSSSTVTMSSEQGRENDSVSKLLSTLPRRTLYSWESKPPGLTKGNSHQVEVEQVSMFITKDNCVLTFFEHGANDIVDPLLRKLESRKSLLRESNDPTVLVQAILDAAVEMLHPISAEYQQRLLRLQEDSMSRPTLRQTRALHNLVTDLGALRSVASSMTSLLSSLQSLSNFTVCQAANVYFRDVANHTERYADEIEMLSRQAKALTGLIFNTISTSANDSLNMLSLVATIFMPMTFLTGYYGMNFKVFTALDSDVGYYWTIAGPAAGGLTALLLLPWLKNILLSGLKWSMRKIRY